MISSQTTLFTRPIVFKLLISLHKHRNLAAGATGVKSGLVNDFLIPEYPEADMWLEELLRSSMTLSLVRGD